MQDPTKTLVAKEEKPPVTVTSPVILSALAAVFVRGNSNGKARSFEYWLEECITRGANQLIRQWDAATDRENRDAFVKASALLDPTAKDFIDQFNALKVKYRIGSERVELS